MPCVLTMAAAAVAHYNKHTTKRVTQDTETHSSVGLELVLHTLVVLSLGMFEYILFLLLTHFYVMLCVVQRKKLHSLIHSFNIISWMLDCEYVCTCCDY